MSEKISDYKRIATVIFNSGLKEIIYCKSVEIGRSFPSGNVSSIDFENPQYEHLYINAAHVSAIFVEDNPEYDKSI